MQQCEYTGPEHEEDDELPGSLAATVGVIEQQWPHTMDAQVWASKWMEHMQANPSIATDEGAMIGWFANAIMAGHDTGLMRATSAHPPS